MSNDTNMDGNEVLKDFDTVRNFIVEHGGQMVEIEVSYMDYNALHRVWEKFRELRFDDLHLKARLKHANLCQAIAHAMAYGTLTDFYNALVNAVKWYNEVTKQKQ